MCNGQPSRPVLSIERVHSSLYVLLSVRSPSSTEGTFILMIYLAQASAAGMHVAHK